MTAEVFLDTNVLVYAAILAAAESMGAATVYSEDLNDGQLYGPLRVVNPFA